MRNNTINFIYADAAAPQRFLCGANHGANSMFEYFPPIHFYVMHAVA